MRNADPITLEVVKNALSSIADEMALVILRTAYSSIVRDSMDYSTGLCDREGRVIAHGLTMALHLGAFPDAMQALLRDFGGDIHEGDVFVFNDPYVAGGMHLPDVYIVKPIVVKGELEGFACTLVHQIDMGGIAPGSTAVYATEIYQEGLRLPPVKMYQRGKPNDTFFRIMQLNTRIPDKLAGDMRAQIAACNSAERSFRALVERHGSEAFRGMVEELHDYAERLTRAELAALPDGTWSFTDYIDGLGDEPEPIELKATVTIAGDSLTVDWTGSSAQVKGAINCPSPFVKSAVHLMVKCIARQEIPNFEGYLRPLRIVLPEGTIVNPTPPAAVAARAIVGWRAIDTLMGVFAQIAPERIGAAGEGGVTFPAFSGWHNGQRYVLAETLAGSWGAMRNADGEFGIPNPGGTLTNHPIEKIEALYPIEIEAYGMVENSGGPGKYRGAPGIVRRYRMLGAETTIVMRADRQRHLPWPLDGGSPGTPSYHLVMSNGTQRVLPQNPMYPVRLAQGETFVHIGAGGAGVGDPLERDPAQVLEDVREERISADYARDVYGVDVADAAKTRQLRAQLRASRDAHKPRYLAYFLKPLGVRDYRVEDGRNLSAR
jgi:N-methylhydantoinase B